MTLYFLSCEDVLELHAVQMERYGGLSGIRDKGLLESAVAQPQTTFGDVFVHEDVYVMAAAYLFHLVKNHPFLDGNKRTGLLACLTFLDVNGVSWQVPDDELYDLAVGIAEGRCTKAQTAEKLRQICARSF